MRALILLLCIAVSSLWGAAIQEPAPNPTSIRIVPVKPTPESDNVQTRIVFPRQGQLFYSTPSTVQVQLTGFPVGTYSDFDRAREIYNDPMGQSLLVFIDNNHPIEIYKSFVDSLDRNNLYFDLTLTTRIPYNLSEGEHVIRAFPDRSYGESLKGPGNYAAAIFYVGTREDTLNFNLSDPYLTYNEPLATLTYTEQRPILLDFYLSNVQLSRDGYKVRVTINGNVERTLTMWVPYYIYGLKQGRHTVQLELIDGNNQVVKGPFNDVTRTITVGR